MRVLALVLLSGCSFIYNPTNLDHSIDSNTSDVEVVADVDPTMLKLTDAWPAQVFEGAGTGGARPALVVIYGHQIAEDAVVTITPPAVKIVSATIAGDHNFIALALEADDDGTDNDGTSEPLMIGVTQRGGMYSDVLDASKLTLVHLNALTAAPITRPPRPTRTTLATSTCGDANTSSFLSEPSSAMRYSACRPSSFCNT